MVEALTTWQPNPYQEGEFTIGTAVAIVDPSAAALVDPAGVAIFDTGITFAAIDTGVWTASDGS